MLFYTLIGVAVDENSKPVKYKVIDENGSVGYISKQLLEKELDEGGGCLNPADSWRELINGIGIDRYPILNSKCVNENKAVAILGRCEDVYVIADCRGAMGTMRLPEIIKQKLMNAYHAELSDGRYTVLASTTRVDVYEKLRERPFTILRGESVKQPDGFADMAIPVKAKLGDMLSGSSEKAAGKKELQLPSFVVGGKA